MAAPLLLDTCAVIWSMSGAKMTDESLTAIAAASTEKMALSMSPISVWEIGLLVSKGRLAFSVEDWFDALISHSGLMLAEMPPEVLIASSFLPNDAPNNPADRIILATARRFGLQIVTRDQKILEYARKGHAAYLEC
ncbi:type II toxin-antitoxin system VapC family toxin [Candidatus Spongiihabitans sp.]|uniref:type II toxin-antitoxin system VapC family toxin n=1 Tax=Candidatus Spongiihabitans sp. TaxID=3101308 RepID=UPI003C7E5EA1